MHLKNLFLLKPLFRDFFLFAPRKSITVLALLITSGMTSGVSILLIVPLLNVIGIGLDSGGATSVGVGQFLVDATALFGVSLTLGYVLIFYLVAVLMTGLIGYFNSILSADLKRSFVIETRNKTFAKIMHAKWQFLSQERSSEFIRLITKQVSSIGGNLNQVLMLVGHVITVFIYMAISTLLSPVMTGLAFLCALGLVGVLFPINAKIHRSGEVELRSSRQMFNDVVEQLSSLKLIKSYGAEPAYMERMAKTNARLETQQMMMSRYSAITRLVNLFGAALIFTLLFYVAVQFVALPISNLLVILFIFSRLMPKVSSIQTIIQRLIHAAPDYSDLLKKLGELEDHKEVYDEAGCAPRLSKEFRIENLGYQYPSKGRPVFTGLSTCIQKNQTVAIVGPSGSGKSTLADLISGLLAPNEGETWVDDLKLDDSNRHLWRKQVAYVTQDVFLFHDSVRANLSWIRPGGVQDKEIWDALTLSAAEGFVRNLPDGLDTLIGDRGIKLSGGERQRLALARALLCEPDILILDEATSALDRENELRIRDALINLDGKLTIIIIAHNETTIEHVQQRIELKLA